MFADFMKKFHGLSKSNKNQILIVHFPSVTRGPTKIWARSVEPF